MPRIGIPRALLGLQYYPLWRTFFEELGAQVVTSPPTNREIVATGTRMVADVTCLPVKVYAGHVAWLRDQGKADLILVPAIRSVERGALHCSKFMGLPDLIHATVPDLPQTLEPEIDVHHYKISPTAAYLRLGREFTGDSSKIRYAWERACHVDEAFRNRMVAEQVTYPEALASSYPNDWTAPTTRDRGNMQMEIALVGHPYCLHDDYINHKIISRLHSLGVRVHTSEMVSTENALRGIELTTGQTRWFYENWMSGAAGHYLVDRRIAGVIAVLAFACGPDSTMVETMTRRAHALERPMMSLVLDEHGSAAGMITRLEAFVDMLSRQETRPDRSPGTLPEARSTISSSPPGEKANGRGPIQGDIPVDEPHIAVPVLLREIHKPRVGFPRMGTSTIPIKSLFEGIGVQVELGPSLSSRTVSLGVRHSPEFICTPYKYILGNMIELLEAGADTLLYMDGADLCRNSTYSQLMNDVLHDLGHEYRLVSTQCFEKGGILALPEFLRQFVPDLSWSLLIREMRLAMDKMGALDDIERRVQFLRPREIVSGTVDKLWTYAQLRIDRCKSRAMLKQVTRDALQQMKQVEINPDLHPVKIATTGEYYAVLEPFYNLNLERTLGQLGAEVTRPLMLGDWVKLRMIWEALGVHKSEIDQAAKPYVRWNVGGEGLVTVGQTVIHARKGFSGIVELLPFTCLPEITVLNILPRVSRDFNIPILSFILDEQSGQAGMKTRLEAFVDLLQRRRELPAVGI